MGVQIDAKYRIFKRGQTVVDLVSFMCIYWDYEDRFIEEF